MEFIKQNKGLALQKVNQKHRQKGNYYASLKRDGQMIQIAYDGDTTVRFWSSNGHEFYNHFMADQIIEDNVYAFHIEAEYTGVSKGMLGDRRNSSKITTYRTEFAKGIKSIGTEKERCYVFDILSFDNEDVRSDMFEDRLGMLNQLAETKSFKIVRHMAGYTIEEGLAFCDECTDEYWEGAMLTHATHVIKPSGRSPLRIKLKENPTGYATIIGVNPGTEEREGTIGSLQLRDEEGFEFPSGGGLNMQEWTLDPDLVANSGLTVKFAYESVKGNVYQQQRYLGVCNEDKSLSRLNEVLK